MLVVAVVAVVSFQGWFQTYQSSMFSDTETKSNSAIDGSIKIDQLIGNSLYIINNVEEGLNVTSLKIGGDWCNLTNLSLGMNEIDVSNCIDNLSTSTPDIVLITDQNVVVKKVLAQSVNPAQQTIEQVCASLDGGDWIPVPGNSTLGIDDFCVMKYEARFVNTTGKATGGNTLYWNTSTGDMNITSTDSGIPISYIGQADAETACQSIGVGNYHLISDLHWVTIARNAELQDVNWDSGTRYSGLLIMGHSDGSPAQALSISNVNDPYDQTGQSSGAQRRTLELSNGEVIWDFGGNIEERTSDSLPTTGSPQNSSLGLVEGWREWSAVASAVYGDMMPANTSLNSANGVGQVYVDETDAPYGSTHAFVRGGFWNLGATWAGIYGLNLNYGPSTLTSALGFRCIYEP